ncbi:MAG: 4'-phosphopantetheinyl transferase superfamily protein [Desulfobacterales bacterium]|nr:4'-phosphopantetheinyl transferase superfamily protein [Desulfobacterales bacterium]
MKSENQHACLRHPPFFKDHHVDGRPVLPAVEAMENLAADSLVQFPDTDLSNITEIAFDKFLFLDPRENGTPVHHNLDLLNDGSVRATLQTKIRAPQAAITRTKVHAAMTIGDAGLSAPTLPLDLAAAPEGICKTVAPEKLYAELVPFGSAYRNIVQTLFLGNDGAIARVGSPSPSDNRKDFILGSPYPLDAAFHAACVWGQYTRQIVAFPVAIGHRQIVRPTRQDETCIARILPREVTGETLVYDIYIFDRQGNLCEVSAGVRMRDISGGRTHPPEWIRRQNGENRLTHIETSGCHLAVIEQGCVAPFVDQTLSSLELQRYTPMVAKRKNSFAAARLALKRLIRELSDPTPRRSPGEINTVQANSPKPACPVAGLSKPPFCSLSHDGRFAVAVTSEKPVGIDVEQITAKALHNRRLFMDESEAALTKDFAEGEAAAALRVWSAKEAAAKALDIPLAKAWDRVKITSLQLNTSRLEIKDLGTHEVIHDTVDDHLFTLLVL